jgi:hypothetical protein
MLTLKLSIEILLAPKKRFYSIFEYVFLLKFCNRLIEQELVRDYGLALEKRSEIEKKSATGRQETALYGQMRAYIRPFFVDLLTHV